MFIKLNLHDNTRINIRREDGDILLYSLNRLALEMQKLSRVNSDLEMITLKAGIVSARVFCEEQISDEVKNYESDIEPLKSFGYFGISVIYSNLFSNETFKLTQKYFKDLFLLQSAIILEKSRTEKNKNYLKNLEVPFEKFSKTYEDIFNKQQTCFEEIRIFKLN
ncbi:MAG: hypothetical protein ACOYT4_04990 [Nanoarchaeota archaeon]